MSVELEGGRLHLVFREGGAELRVQLDALAWAYGYLLDLSHVYMAWRRGRLRELVELVRACREAQASIEVVGEVVRALAEGDVESARRVVGEVVRHAPGDEPRLYRHHDDVVLATRHMAFRLRSAHDWPSAREVLDGLPPWRYGVLDSSRFTIPSSPGLLEDLVRRPGEYYECLVELVELWPFIRGREVRRELVNLLATKGPEGFREEGREALRRARRLKERREAAERAEREVIVLEDGVIVPLGSSRSGDAAIVTRDGEVYYLPLYRARGEEVVYRAVKRGRVKPLPGWVERAEGDNVLIEELREAVRRWSGALREAAPWIFFIL